MKYLIAFTAPFLLIYLIAAFVVWDLNPEMWHPMARFLAAGFGLPAALFAVVEVK